MCAIHDSITGQFDQAQEAGGALVGSSRIVLAHAPIAMPTYLIAPVRHRLNDPLLLERWQALLATSSSPERIYQTPAYFAYALASGMAGAELFTVNESSSGRLVGIVPVLERAHSLDFSVGARQLASLAVPSVVVLGSVPLLPPDAVLWQQLCRFLLARYPHCQAVSLTSLPAPQLPPPVPATLRHVPHGWRDCHQVPLQADYAALLAQLGSKRRYNLKRQLRLLEEQRVKLALHAITQPAQLPTLSAALTALSDPHQRRQWLSDASLLSLAERGLLLCYVLKCAEQPAALILALTDGTVLHVNNILHDPALAQLSAGTAILFIAMEDACQRGLRALDFGYGSPAHSYQSTNVTQRRGHVLILRANLRNYLGSMAHRLWCASVEWARRRR
jgi:CelD/BcsL family acetyltransferase involved in cellulose biosynthesis